MCSEARSPTSSSSQYASILEESVKPKKFSGTAASDVSDGLHIDHEANKSTRRQQDEVTADLYQEDAAHLITTTFKVNFDVSQFKR